MPGLTSLSGMISTLPDFGAGRGRIAPQDWRRKRPRIPTGSRQFACSWGQQLQLPHCTSQ